MKILILGASGTVGGAIFRYASAQYQCWGTYNKNNPADLDPKRMAKWDIADTNALKQLLIDISPDIVISSLTGDFETQISAHRYMAEYLQKAGKHMIFISTANVFDGATNKPHTESDKPYPVSQYGKFKLECEQLLQSALKENCLIIRIPKIMTRQVADNYIFGEPVYKNLYAGFNTPENVAKAVVKCIQLKKYGILHLSSHDYMSIDTACTHMGKVGYWYAVKDLTAKAYATMMNCELDDIQLPCDDNFYLALQSEDKAFDDFSISCHDIMSIYAG